jgi:hypothetical protein
LNFKTHSDFFFSSALFSCSNCSILSTRAWWRQRNKEGVSTLGWVSSSSSEIYKLQEMNQLYKKTGVDNEIGLIKQVAIAHQID